MSSDTRPNAGSAFDRNLARIAVGGYNDAQQERTSLMNRVRDLVRKMNEDIPFDEVEEQKDEDDYASKYEDENLPELIEEMSADGTLSPHQKKYLDEMLEAAEVVKEVEQRYQEMFRITEREPIYQQWLKHVYGISTTLTAKLIHRFGYCESSPKVANLWSYSGLAPGNDTRERGEKAGFDPQAKTLAWLCADRIIMQGSNSKYKVEFYDPYKAEQIRRMEESECRFCGKPTHEHYNPKNVTGRFCTEEMNRGASLEDFEIGPGVPDEADPAWSRGHADLRARRYLAKKFLKHYWWNGRTIQGLPTPDEYILVHGEDIDGQPHEKQTDSFENPAYARRVLQDPAPADD